MESKEDLVKMAVEQGTDSRKRKTSAAESSSSHKDGTDDEDDHHNQLLISRLLSQQLEEEEKKKKMEEPSSSLAVEVEVDDQGNQDGAENDMEISRRSNSSRNEDEIILRELRKVKKQNFITHCLLSAMIVITLTWQLCEVSMIFKLKDGITHPFKSITQMLRFKKDTQLPLLKQLPPFDLKQDKEDDDDDDD